MMTIREAMPGTAAEIAERTGLSVAAVLKQIVNLRKAGTRIFAREDGFSRNVARLIDPEHRATTIFEVDG